MISYLQTWINMVICIMREFSNSEYEMIDIIFFELLVLIKYVHI